MKNTFARHLFKGINWFYFPSPPSATPQNKINKLEGFGPHLCREDVRQGKSVLAVFLGEIPQDFKAEQKDDLLSKMIGAMDCFAEGEAVRILFSKEGFDPEQVWPEIASDLLHLRPKVLITMGVRATNMALQRKERLSQIHGQKMPLHLTPAQGANLSLNCFPIFHPDILQINPNMKRSVWIDLQNIAHHLRAKV